MVHVNFIPGSGFDAAHRRGPSLLSAVLGTAETRAKCGGTTHACVHNVGHCCKFLNLLPVGYCMMICCLCMGYLLRLANWAPSSDRRRCLWLTGSLWQPGCLWHPGCLYVLAPVRHNAICAEASLASGTADHNTCRIRSQSNACVHFWDLHAG